MNNEPMTGERVNQIMFVAVTMACQELDDLELCAQYNALTAGSDPTHARGYDKISHLFDRDDGKRMHPDTAAVFGRVVAQRLAMMKP